MALETGYVLDTKLLVANRGAAITATAVGADGSGTALIVDMGDGNDVGEMVVDVSAIDVASGNELYTLSLEGCNTSDFSTGTPTAVPLSEIKLGHSSVLTGAFTGSARASTGTGRFVVPYRNEQNGTRYRYMRLLITCAGTTPSITLVAFLSKRKW